MLDRPPVLQALNYVVTTSLNGILRIVSFEVLGDDLQRLCLARLRQFEFFEC